MTPKERVARAIALELGLNFDRMKVCALGPEFTQDDMLRAAQAAIDSLSEQGKSRSRLIEHDEEP
ncbi:MAG TPA: hypothetical protein VGG20_22360 [Thermoanaerobaculia bacterium]|jgi:hypothetical protein